MSVINVTNLTFGYEGSVDNVFENVSFIIDTDWKLGFIGRNGRGKTTFLKLLQGEYEYQGSIQSTTVYDYFPYDISNEGKLKCGIDIFGERHPEGEDWKLFCELEKLKLNSEILYRPFNTLSHGEQTKVMLAMLFSQDNYFLLIDEPTNHLDIYSRNIVKTYLKNKKGFILISHDRDLLDDCIDHILVINPNSVCVEKGNFSSWRENKEKKDAFELAENHKHMQEIGKLKVAAQRASAWADKSENRKIGYDPIKENDRSIATRSYMGAKTKKMESRRKNIEERVDREIKQKENLLKNIEVAVDLKLVPMDHFKEVYIEAKDFGISYVNNKKKNQIFNHIDFQLKRGERILLQGGNGSGKSSIIKAILEKNSEYRSNVVFMGKVEYSGSLEVVSGLKISYINQDTSYLKGTLKDYIEKNELNESLLKTILRQLDLEAVQFGKYLEDYSQGQKKKLLIATSLMSQGHLYIWDEPLNYIDVFSRIQIENLILKYKPTMLIVEHDPVFGEKVATKIISL